MEQTYTTGTWTPKAGAEEAFIVAWTEFAGWASGVPGAGKLQLTRDLGDPQRFVSFGGWDAYESMRAWKGAPDFRERMARLLQHVEAFAPSELALLATAESGRGTVLASSLPTPNRVASDAALGTNGDAR